MIEVILTEVNRKTTAGVFKMELVIEPVEKEKHITHTMNVSYEAYLRDIFINIKSSLSDILYSVTVDRSDNKAFQNNILKYLEGYDIKVVGYKDENSDSPRMVDENGDFK